MERPKQKDYKRELPLGLIEDSHYQYSKAQDKYIDYLEAKLNK